MKVAVVNYGAGNTASVVNALARLGVEARVTDDADAIRGADKVIFPGVGEASAAMGRLRASGLDSVIRDLTQPFLGICLGMQLLCDSSEENGTECLGLIPIKVKRFPPNGLKVPQIGWNRLAGVRSSLFAGVESGAHVYFVHGYFAETSARTIASAEYGFTFSAAIHNDNFYGVQFHPEKSGVVGQRILENFLKL